MTLAMHTSLPTLPVLHPLRPTGPWICDYVCQRTEPEFGPEQIVADVHGFC